MKVAKLIFRLLLLSVIFVSCEEEVIKEIEVEKEVEVEKELIDFKGSIVVSSEGNFGSKDGSISVFKDQLTSTDVFTYNNANQVKLGGLIQSVYFGETNAYIILNDVNQIVVVDKRTFKKKAVIETDIQNPRYMTIANGVGYITNWGDGNSKTDDYVAVVDLSMNKVISKISLSNGVERIISNETSLYVTHKGGFFQEKTVSVIKIADESVTEITVNDKPDEIVFDEEDNLIVLCEGNPLTFNDDFSKTLTSTESSITYIDITTNQVSRKITFPNGEVPTLLSYSNNKIYYYISGNTKIFEIEKEATQLATNEVYTLSKVIYGMEVNENKLFALTRNFTSLSEINVYDLESMDNIYKSVVGLGASKIYFVE